MSVVWTCGNWEGESAWSPIIRGWSVFVRGTVGVYYPYAKGVIKCCWRAQLVPQLTPLVVSVVYLDSSVSKRLQPTALTFITE
jgi:hypothetical protein